MLRLTDRNCSSETGGAAGAARGGGTGWSIAVTACGLRSLELAGRSSYAGSSGGGWGGGGSGASNGGGRSAAAAAAAATAAEDDDDGGAGGSAATCSDDCSSGGEDSSSSGSSLTDGLEGEGRGGGGSGSGSESSDAGGTRAADGRRVRGATGRAGRPMTVLVPTAWSVLEAARRPAGDGGGSSGGGGGGSSARAAPTWDSTGSKAAVAGGEGNICGRGHGNPNGHCEGCDDDCGGLGEGGRGAAAAYCGPGCGRGGRP